VLWSKYQRECLVFWEGGSEMLNDPWLRHNAIYVYAGGEGCKE